MVRAQVFRAAGFALVVALAVTTAEPAWGQSTDECVTAFDAGQTLRDAASLRSARERFALCSRASCPTPLRADCSEALAALARDMPSIVPGARSADGNDVANVRVFVDGAPVAIAPGAALDLDPGPHSIRYESAGYVTASTEIVVRVGERNRPLLLTMVPKSEGDAGERAPSPVPPRSPWILPLAAFGVAAIGTFAYFGINGLGDREDAERCAPHCPDHIESRVRTQFIAADVSLLVGLLALGGATYLFFAPRSAPQSALR